MAIQVHYLTYLIEQGKTSGDTRAEINSSSIAQNIWILMTGIGSMLATNGNYKYQEGLNISKSIVYHPSITVEFFAQSRDSQCLHTFMTTKSVLLFTRTPICSLWRAYKSGCVKF